ncbi:MAG: hypothetical protein EXX96DRAFT_168839 [Benjaminiella poitrasii]|nr:MAG: hypothetical protein EXX96DRAFT_168839 [Benjaminiella poitrasii]
MLEEKWESALDEIDLVFQRSTYHHPTILRKLAFCSYYRWKKARKQLPQSYLEGEIEIEDIEQSTIDKYSNYLAFAMEKLSFAHNTLPYDVELLEKYCELLSIMNDHEIKKSVILKSLEAYKKSPNYYLIFFLLEENANNVYFEGEPFIMEMYELDPTLDDKFGLRKVVEMTCAQIDKIIPCGEDEARIVTLKKQAIGLFELFVKRIEYGKLDLWYLKQVRDSILTNALRDL